MRLYKIKRTSWLSRLTEDSSQEHNLQQSTRGYSSNKDSWAWGGYRRLIFFTKTLKTWYQHTVHTRLLIRLDQTGEIASPCLPLPQPEDLRRRELPELFDALNYVLKKFKFKTGANDQYIYMVLGALMNEYKKSAQKESDATWK